MEHSLEDIIKMSGKELKENWDQVVEDSLEMLGAHVENEEDQEDAE